MSNSWNHNPQKNSNEKGVTDAITDFNDLINPYENILLKYRSVSWCFKLYTVSSVDLLQYQKEEKEVRRRMRKKQSIGIPRVIKSRRKSSYRAILRSRKYAHKVVFRIVGITELQHIRSKSDRRTSSPVVYIVSVGQVLFPLRITIEIEVNFLISKERKSIYSLR